MFYPAALRRIQAIRRGDAEMMLCFSGLGEMVNNMPAVVRPSMHNWAAHRKRVVELDRQRPAGTPPEAHDEPGQPIGFFKIKMRLFDRWFVCNSLPSEPIYHEWIYFNAGGVPLMYWNAKRDGIILFG
jgi:hypothetical protein